MGQVLKKISKVSEQIKSTSGNKEMFNNYKKIKHIPEDEIIKYKISSKQKDEVVLEESF